MDEFESIDEQMGQTVQCLLEKMDDDELERLHCILLRHLSTEEGKNDSAIEGLFSAVEYEQIHR